MFRRLILFHWKKKTILTSLSKSERWKFINFLRFQQGQFFYLLYEKEYHQYFNNLVQHVGILLNFGSVVILQNFSII